MKQMTCSDMGGGMPGLCKTMITGNTAEEMAANGRKHVEKSHPEIVKMMGTQTQEQQDKWFQDFKKKFDAAPEM